MTSNDTLGKINDGKLSTDLSFPLEKYYNTQSIEEMRDYLIIQYEDNLFIIYESMLALILNTEDEDKLKILSKEVEKIKEDFELYNSMFEKDMTTRQYTNMTINKLQNLIDWLEKNEDEFYRKVLNSDNPNFLMTTYYSLYLLFITAVYSELHKTITTNSNTKTEDPKIKDILNITDFLVELFGMPILIYIKKREVVPYISELSGVLLHTLIEYRTSLEDNAKK